VRVRRGCRIYTPPAAAAGSTCHPLRVSDPPAVRRPARSTLPHSFPSSPTAAAASVPPQLGQNISDNELLWPNTCRPSIQFVFFFFILSGYVFKEYHICIRYLSDTRIHHFGDVSVFCGPVRWRVVVLLRVRWTECTTKTCMHSWWHLFYAAVAVCFAPLTDPSSPCPAAIFSSFWAFFLVKDGQQQSNRR
jgi:hypothetical protein